MPKSRRMLAGNPDSVKILSMAEHPEHARIVSGWIFREWGGSNEEAFEASLIEPSPCPSALVATHLDEPVGVLSYKFYALNPPAAEDLWINALFVKTDWRSKGVGARLLEEGVALARNSGQEFLYVYTDVPSYYEHHGWTLFRTKNDNGMTILRIPL